jgi:Dynamin family
MSPTVGFVDQVGSLLASARQVYAGTAGQAEVDAVGRRLEEPLRVAIAGKVKAGKSTLLNALVGDELAPTDAGECTRLIWWFRDGITYRATLHARVGPARPLRFNRHAGALEVDLDGVAEADIERLEIEWPSRALRAMTLIDTPGIASATPSIGETAEAFLDPDDEHITPADAVIYLMRHLHSADVRFLEAFQDDEHVQATPVNTIAVLSRADELGVGRADAMHVAARIAERYRSDRKLKRMCQAVVPIAGLLAQAAVTLRESDFRMLRRLGELPQDELDELLLSVDRFSLRACTIPPGERSELLHRFGIFGIRVGVRFITTGAAPSASKLSDALLQESGLVELRTLLDSQFAARRNLLKGRAALLALQALVRRMPVPGSDNLGADVERVRAGAHELAEVRLLNALRAGSLPLPDADIADAERLLGAAGTDLPSRLGLDADAPADVVARALNDAVARWQRRAESPVSPQAAVEAAEVVVRTCEGLAAALATETTPR